MAGSDLKVILDFSPLIKSLQQLENLKAPIKKSLEALAMGAFEEAIILVNKKFPKDAENKLYLENLEFKKNTTGGFDKFLIIWHEPLMYLEEGRKATDMRDTHLKGKKYVRIPFLHSKNFKPTMDSKKAAAIKEIKTAMKANKIPITKTLLDGKGMPILSSLSSPKAAATIKNVSSAFKGSVSGKSILNNLNIYQTKNKNGGIDKTYMTFRTLSENSKASWIIPARPPADIYNETFKWIETHYQTFLDQAVRDINLIIA